MTRDRVLGLLLAYAFVLGFYIALLIVAVVLGDDGFAAAFPNPWRALLLLPVVVCLCSEFARLRRG